MLTIKTNSLESLAGRYPATIPRREAALAEQSSGTHPATSRMTRFCADPVIMDNHLTWYGGLMTRICMVNMTLKYHRLDNAGAAELTQAAATQLVTLQAMARAKNPAGSRAALSQFTGTITRLQEEYSTLLATPDLPDDVAFCIRSLLRSLDAAVAQTVIV